MKLRWGICGAGNISSEFCHALRTLPTAEDEIVAIASSSADRAKEFAQNHNIGRSYGRYEDVATDADIGLYRMRTSRFSFLYSIYRDMAHQSPDFVAGKHVLCEKPLCVNTEQVKEVFRVAKENNRFFMEAIWSRAFPIYKKIRDEIRSGNIGDVQLVTAAFCFPSCEHPIWKDYNGFGTLPLIGIYTLQFANWIFENKKPSSVTAVGTLGQKGSDEDGCIILSYDNGAKASLSYSGKCQILNGAVVYGAKGCIQGSNDGCSKQARDAY